MVITRFAPSPTGLLHVGSVRPALVNYLFAQKMGGKFILRIDDTDLARSTEHFKTQLLVDLAWLGLVWDDIFYQSARLSRYDEVFKDLLAKGFIYPCFETPEELEIKRKTQLINQRPPIYDRSALNLTQEQIEQYTLQGIKPHYRFKLTNKEISWQDLVRNKVSYQASSISDPIVIRQDGTFTYMLCSAIDDADYGITHIFRGEDHINNTAIQLQMFEAMNAKIPELGHLSFLKAKEEKISKREGGFEVCALEQEGVCAMAINSFFAYIGTSKFVTPQKNLAALVQDFDIGSFSPSPTIYDKNELLLLNHKLLLELDYIDVKDFLKQMDLGDMDEAFWLAIRPNLQLLKDAKIWWTICHTKEIFSISAKLCDLDKNFLSTAIDLLPEGSLDNTSWSFWTKALSQATGKKGRELFMPLRIALTGMDNGPEMALLLPLIPKELVIARLKV